MAHVKGRGFEFRNRILDEHWTFFHIDCKNCIDCLKRLKINEKEAGVGSYFFLKKIATCNVTIVN